MSAPIKTGQGLVAHGLGAALQRWAAYAKITLVIVALCMTALIARETSGPQRMLGTAYAEARLKLWLADGQPVEPTVKIAGHRGAFDVAAREIVATPAAARAWSALVRASLRGLGLGAVLGALASLVWSAVMDRWGRRAARDRVIRGADVLSARALATMTEPSAGERALRLGEVAIPTDLETRHAAFVGSPGSGKTTALRQWLDGLEARGETALVYDTSGEFVAHYYRPERGDVILNPFDARGAYWNPFDEITHPADADRIAHLAERGKTRETASAAERQMATLDTRMAKEVHDRADLVTAWRARADAAGFDREARFALMDQAKARAERRSAEDRLAKQGEAEAAARAAVGFAAEKLGERQSVFSAAELEKEAGRRLMGRAGQDDVLGAIGRATEVGDLETRAHSDRRGAEGAGFTTRQNIADELALLRAEYRGRGMAQPVAGPVEAARIVASAVLAAKDQGHAWTADQQAATRAILASRNQVVAVQGYAGTAKTTTVLTTFAKAADAAGYEVRAMAPSASAAQTLGQAVGLESQTLARHLKTETDRGEARAPRREVWLVDEASLVSARDMARLLERAEAVGARTVLVGDTKQLGSVGAGAAFAQLQGAGMETARLTEIVRQTNAKTKEAVEATLEGQIRRAFEALDAGGGRIIEAATPEARRASLAADYARLSLQERARTIVIDPSREGREALNAEIRRELIAQGALGKDAIVVSVLVAKDLTKAEARQVDSYGVGEVVVFTQRDQAYSVRRGEAFTVAAVDAEQGRLSLVGETGRVIDWAPAQWGKAEAFARETRELREGDRVEFTRNDPATGRANGGQAELTRVLDARSIEVLRADGRVEILSLDQARDQHLRHAYVQTAHAAQGRTAERIMVHAESGRANLVDQASMYVALSRARSEAVVYTDDRGKLAVGVAERQVGAMSAIDGSAAWASRDTALMAQ